MNTSKSILLLVSFLFTACGLHYYAERYTIAMPCNEAIEAIHQFTKDNPQFKCTQTNEKGESYENGEYYYYSEKMELINTPSLTDSTEYYTFYFHLPDIKADIHCIIDVGKQFNNNTNTCTLNFGGITYSPNWASWKTINNEKEISKEDNELIKKKFETEILDRIFLDKWKRKRWYN